MLSLNGTVHENSSDQPKALDIIVIGKLVAGVRVGRGMVRQWGMQEPRG